MWICFFCPTLNFLRTGTTSHLFILVSLKFIAQGVGKRQSLPDLNSPLIAHGSPLHPSSPSLFLLHPFSQLPPFTISVQCPKLRDSSMNKTFYPDGYVLHMWSSTRWLLNHMWLFSIRNAASATEF